MVSKMKKVYHPGIEEVLYPWGKAELTDEWIIIHKEGNPKWAISDQEKTPSMAITHRLRSKPKKTLKRRKLAK